MFLPLTQVTISKFSLDELAAKSIAQSTFEKLFFVLRNQLWVSSNPSRLIVKAPNPAFNNEICFCWSYRYPFVTRLHRTPRLLISRPHNSISFRKRGSPPVKTTIKWFDFDSIVSSAARKSVNGMSLIELSFEQSLPQCKQL